MWISLKTPHEVSWRPIINVSLALIALLIFIVDISSMKQALLLTRQLGIFHNFVCFIQMIMGSDGS